MQEQHPTVQGRVREVSTIVDDLEPSERDHHKRLSSRRNTFVSKLQRVRAQAQDAVVGFLEEVRAHPTALLASMVVFFIFWSAGAVITRMLHNKEMANLAEEATEQALETANWFKSQLDTAILPLYSLGQFATEIDVFQALPDQIGPAYGPHSAPMADFGKSDTSAYRNVSGICDDQDLVQRFTDIAATLKAHVDMRGTLVNLNLAPQGVMCMMFPQNNTQDFGDGLFFDISSLFGADLIIGGISHEITIQTLMQEEVLILGPERADHCPECGNLLYVLLPVVSKDHVIEIGTAQYPRWGVATAWINWDALVKSSNVVESYTDNNRAFQLLRRHQDFAQTRTSGHGTYHGEHEVVDDEQLVVFVKTDGYDDLDYTSETVSACNHWVARVKYNMSARVHLLNLGVPASFIFAAGIAVLVYTVLKQRQDHSEMKREQLAQDAMVTTEKNMTAYFAHELRNPLGAIDSALLAMPDDIPQSAKDLVSDMHLCTTFMSSIMNNLLDSRKIEEGKMQLHLQPYELDQILIEIYRMEKASVKQGVEFKVKCVTKRHNWVICDKPRVQQILTNIVTNAIKYTTQGSITLSVKWEGTSVRFVCEDTGPGIPKSEQENMFKRFVQRGGAPGTGLGLAISKQLVDYMGGSIRFESDPTERPGTTCVVLLPLLVCDPQERSSTLDQSDESAIITDPLSILIVDDIKMNRSMLSRRFKKSVAPNCTIKEASTGEEALEIAKDEHFDVYVIDHYMESAGGVMVGTDVVIALLRMGADGVIIGCSGNEVNTEFQEAGANWTWTKPLPKNETMIRQLRREFDRRRLRLNHSGYDSV